MQYNANTAKDIGYYAFLYRSLLFSTQINLPAEPEFQQDPSLGKDSYSGCKASTGPGPMKHHIVGSLEVPEHYCKRRSSYCNQDEDEDKTDLEGVVTLTYRDSPDTFVEISMMVV